MFECNDTTLRINVFNWIFVPNPSIRRLFTFEFKLTNCKTNHGIQVCSCTSGIWIHWTNWKSIWIKIENEKIKFHFSAHTHASEYSKYSIFNDFSFLFQFRLYEYTCGWIECQSLKIVKLNQTNFVCKNRLY